MAKKDSSDDLIEIFDGYLANQSEFDKKLYEYVIENNDKELLPYKNFIKEKTIIMINNKNFNLKLFMEEIQNGKGYI